METTGTRFISVTDENKKRIAAASQCGERMVYYALTYRRDSKLAQKIRHIALREYGGRVMSCAPQCETIHDTTEDGRQVMRQVFDNGATLLVDKGTGEAWVTDCRGETVASDYVEKLTELYEMQRYAAKL